MTGYESKKAAAQNKLEPVDYEKLAALGWQAIECPFCGSSGAQAFPKPVVQPAQEPVAWRYDHAKYRENDLRGRQWAFNVFSQARPYMDEMVQNVTPLYAAPPQRPWVGLKEEEQSALVYKYGDTPVALCLETERKLKEMNNAT